MKILNASIEPNEDTFDPEIRVECTIPINIVEAGKCCNPDEFYAIIGKDFMNQLLEKIKT